MFSLVPPQFRSIMKTSVKVGFFCEIVFCIVLLCLSALGFFQDMFSAIVSFAVFLLVIPIALMPCFLHYKISQSCVDFFDDSMKVFDRKGTCWREIPYAAIKSYRVEQINGFFYGLNHQEVTNRYICIFTGDPPQIPDVPYGKLYKSKEFFMIYYDEKAWELLSRIFNYENSMLDDE